MSLSAETAEERIRAGVFRVASVERDAVRRDPVPPFTTAPLQQAASRPLGFGARKTMPVAQGLYEGVAPDGVGYRAQGRRAVSVFRLGLREGGRRPRASAVAAALRTFGFGAAPPGAGLALALLAALALLFAAATAAQAQTTLVSNAGEGRDNAINAGNSASGRITQRFTTGSNMTGYDLSSVGIHIHEDNSSSSETITVSVHRFDSSETNNLGELVATFSTPSTLNEGAVNDFTAPSNTRLLPNTRYLVNIVGVGNHTHDFQIGVTNSDAETGAAGWLIENAFRLNGILVTAAIMMNVKGSNWVPPLIPTLDSAEAFFANGALRYRFDLRLSEGVSIPHREMRDHAFSVTNGHMVKAKRIHKERAGGNLYSNHWRMTVAPADETEPVTVILRGNRPCGETGALCTGSGGWLDGSPTLTLSTDTEPLDLGSLPSLSIADTSGTEDSANLAFDVSLSKAVSATVAVDFRTVSGGTATANADYREASHRIVFSAGETVQPGSVGLIEDAAADAGETVKVEIANARVITPRGAEFGPLSIIRGQATGTINAPASTKTPLSNVNMRIENTSGSERGGWLHFTIRLSRALNENVCYDFETLDTGTASEGIDYLQRPKTTLWQPAGVTEWTEFVRILDDPIDDGGETVQVRISDAELCDDASKTIAINRGEATGTITNSDPIPAAWLARFGRTVADQVIDAVEGRMGAARAPGTEVTLGGQRVGAAGAPEGQAPIETDMDLMMAALGGRTTSEEVRGSSGSLAASEANATRLRPKSGRAAPDLRAGGAGDPEGTTRHPLQGRGMTEREFLLGSSFSLAAGDARTGHYAFWGRGTVSRFDGRDGALTVDGEVVSAFLGADWSRERTTLGLILGHSIGDGGYRSETGRGSVSSTLTGLYPWVRQALGERISVWGVAGYGEGTLTVTLANEDGTSQAAIRTDLELAMGAVGLRGTLVQAPDEGGFELAVKTDAMGVRTRSASVPGLAGASAEVTRLRLGLEGSRPFRFEGGAELRPSIEIGVRQDGGDAETGFGVDVGGGIAWTDPERGLSVDLKGRGLMSHKSKGFREAGISGALSWTPRAESARAGRGPSLTLTQTMGGQASGGADALLERGTLAGLAANDNGAKDGGLLSRRRLEVRFGYGFAAFGDGFTSTPELGFGLSEAARDYRLGWRLSRAAGAGSLDLSLEATRREVANDNSAGGGAGVEPEHTVGLRIEARF
ncbi:MAG: DNA topoisomerase [Rhodospirillaceae bacterium]|nr:DNA topoisomerase [Rhodospirillaceae bacterium]